MESIIAYTENSTICRTQQLLDYFGKKTIIDAENVMCVWKEIN